jgi:UDP:flavonoid glycosyltransferase YjiC (YdhE family)
MTWELGGGWGHLAPLALLAKGLRARGHKIVAVLKDLSQAHKVFPAGPVALLQAPIRSAPPANSIRRPYNFAHILHNIGFADVVELETMIRAWRYLFELQRPNLVLFDHSPTALLAACGLPFRRAVIGTGFCCPPDISPLPELRPLTRSDPPELRNIESKVLANINAVLSRLGQPALQRLTQLYSEVDHTYLTTLQELDHYPQRGQSHYYGAPATLNGKPPDWPTADGKRIFAYLKSFRHLPELLALLRRLAQPTLIYIEKLDRRLVEKFACPTLRFASEPVDLTLAARQCELAILHGTHASALTMLLAGKPTLQIPIYLEQAGCARAVKRLGAGLAARHNRPAHMEEQLRSLLSSSQFNQAAVSFARRYAEFDSRRELEAMIDQLDKLSGLRVRRGGGLVVASSFGEPATDCSEIRQSPDMGASGHSA